MPFLRDSQNRLLCKDGSVVENAQRGRAKGALRRAGLPRDILPNT